MIDGLIAGKLYGNPKQGTSKSGSTYTTVRVRVADGNGESLLAGVIAFDPQAQSALMALTDGDSVALSGSISLKVFEAKDGEHRPSLDMVVHAVLTAYHIRRKRQTVMQDE